MKNYLKYLPLVLLLTIFVVPLIGQNPIDIIDQVKGAVTWDELLSKETAITSGLILIAGYLSPFVPFIRKIPQGAFRVGAFAIIIIVALVKGFAIGSWAGGAIAYFFSTSLYELVFKWIFPSKKTLEVAAKLYKDQPKVV